MIRKAASGRGRHRKASGTSKQGPASWCASPLVVRGQLLDLPRTCTLPRPARARRCRAAPPTSAPGASQPRPRDVRVAWTKGTNGFETTATLRRVTPSTWNVCRLSRLRAHVKRFKFLRFPVCVMIVCCSRPAREIVPSASPAQSSALRRAVCLA